MPLGKYLDATSPADGRVFIAAIERCGSAFATHGLAAGDDNLRSIATSIHRLRHQTTAMQAHTIFELLRRTEAAMLLPVGQQKSLSNIPEINSFMEQA